MQLNLLNNYQEWLRKRESLNLTRTAEPAEHLAGGYIKFGDKKLVNFASNDYLGLRHHPDLRKSACFSVDNYGNGAGASRLLGGTSLAISALEKRIASLRGLSAARIFNSGWQANVSLMTALCDQSIAGGKVSVVMDKLCHNSLVRGAQWGGARLARFRHNDPEHAARLLEIMPQPTIIVTETIFSMDGDLAKLAELSALARAHGAMFIVDEAHATGIMGKSHLGLGAEEPVNSDIVIGTFGKAMGSFGAYVACPQIICDYLTQRADGFIYTTALPPSIIDTVNAALDLLPNLDKQREQLFANAAIVRRELKAQGWNVMDGTTPIIPLFIENTTQTIDIAYKLRERGFYLPAIRPPTVPDGTSRLRIAISTEHDDKTLQSFIATMRTLRQ